MTPKAVAERDTITSLDAAAGLARSLRARQWLKNGFVLAPLLFSGELTDPLQVARAFGAVACFCAAASAVYLFNDVMDRGRDRAHPSKRSRPIAAGTLPVSVAITAAVVLAVAAVAAGALIHAELGVIIVIYLGLQTAYSVLLKHEVIVDVMIIAAGFVLRVVGGAAAIAVDPSVWLIGCTGLLALMLAIGKRHGEVVTAGSRATDQRDVLADYSLPFLNAALVISAGAALAAYAIYSIEGAPEGAVLALTLPFPLYGILRYLWLVLHRHEGGSPTALVYSDRRLQVAILLWIVTSVLIIAL